MKPTNLQIVVPERLSALLAKEPAIYGAIQKPIADFSSWFADNKTPFFLDYTDHGIAHISNVLRSVESLIPESAWPVLTSEDACALIAAVLLHDSAMHLTKEGFFSLLSANQIGASSLHLPEESWISLFEKFQQEASRWGTEKLMDVFGDGEPAEAVEIFGEISDKQKALIGEFVRRHHARLAHEIALNGIPGPGADGWLKPFDGFDQEHQDLFGLIARSHNLPIRAATDLLPRLGRRRYLEVHSPFVMALLRIADYIQIDSARAPAMLLRVRTLKSPVSKQEWVKHHAVLDLNQLNDDPEALVVIAQPKTVHAFCGLKALFADLQKELDETWATLGEVYGRLPDLAVLGLKVRRLYSNLDDVAEFESDSKPKYVPKEIRLTTASAELLHLLVGPLYGNDPSIGVRELLQNAIDATLEREAYERTHGTSRSDQPPTIEIEIDASAPQAKYLRITDAGVGMTLDTLERFFLRAGASFRRSQWWKAEFISDDGAPLVRRSGRFGVGVLAAFLLGPRITLTTRHFLDQTGVGLQLDLGLDEGLIQVTKVLAEIGTSISVRIDEDQVVEHLTHPSRNEVSFNEWFGYEQPAVRYRVHLNGNWEKVERNWLLQSPLIDRDSDWTEVECPGFENVYWSYEAESRHGQHWSSNNYLACNGIFITSVGYGKSLPDISISEKGEPVQADHPSILVNDRGGRLPLNVQRDGVAEKIYPFQRELIQSIAMEYARNLYLALRVRPTSENLQVAHERIKRQMGKFGYSHRHQLIGLSALGWLPLEFGVLQNHIPSVVVTELVQASSWPGVLSRLELASGMLLVPILTETLSMSSTLGYVRSSLEGSGWGVGNPLQRLKKRVVGMRFFMRNEVSAHLKKKGNLPQFLWRELTEVFSKDEWTAYDFGKVPQSVVEGLKLIDLANASESRVFAFTYFDPLEPTKEVATSFSSSWYEICPSGYVHVEEDFALQQAKVERDELS